MKRSLFIIFVLLLSVPSWAYKVGSLFPGKQVSLEVNASSGYYSPSWSVDNPTVQLSSTGFICKATAKAYFGGEATIRCSYKWRVGNKEYSNQQEWTYDCANNSVSVTPTSVTLGVGQVAHLSTSFNLATYMTPSIQYSGYNSSVVQVSSSGAVTAIAPGSTTIYINSNLGNNQATCFVTVTGNGGSSGGDTGGDTGGNTGGSSDDRYVDLGLSVMWAKCNLGASSETGSGGYYAYGESTSRFNFYPYNYTFNNYTIDELSSQGVINAFELTSNYDAATKKLGAGWRMPTYSELNELKTNVNLE